MIAPLSAVSPSVLPPLGAAAAAEVYGLFDDDPAPVVALVRRVRERFLLPEPLDALDVGCGLGRVARALTDGGWRVCGLEPDLAFAVRARRELDGPVEWGGFGQLAHLARWDLIFAVNGPYAYLLSHQERTAALRRAARALRPHGVLLLDVPDLLAFPRQRDRIRRRRVTLGDSEAVLTERWELDLVARRYEQVNEYRLPAADGGERAFCCRHLHAVLDVATLCRELEEVGFVDLHTAAGYPGQTANPRLVVAARRPPPSRGA